MTRSTKASTTCIFAAIFVFAATSASGETILRGTQGETLGTLDMSPVGVTLLPTVEFDQARLVVAGPEGFVFEQTFASGDPLRFGFTGKDGEILTDGGYTFELTFTRVGKRREGGVDLGTFVGRASGHFLMEGAVASLPERTSPRFTSVTAEDMTNATAAAFDDPGEFSARGKIGIFTDDNDEEVHIKSNLSPAILFEAVDVIDNADGSNPATQDTHGRFRIQLLDSSTSGTDGLFTIDSDPGVSGSTGGDIRSVVTIEEGAPANLLYLDNALDPKVGIGTATPGTPIHIAAENAEIRYEEPSATWDVGVPAEDFEFRLISSDDAEATPGVKMKIQDHTGNVGIGTTSPIARLHVVGDGIIAGDVALGSSRTIKHEIEPLDGGEILGAIRSLPLYFWKYKEDPLQASHVGPMAEDIHAAFRLGRDDKHLSPADSAGLALAAIQGIDEAVSELRTRNVELASENRVLRERLAAIEERLSDIVATMEPAKE